MANVLVEETSLSNIASAIRGKNGSTAVYKPGEMAAAITNLPTGGSGGGSSDIEDGLIMGTLTNYENTRVTKIKRGCFVGSNTLATASFPNVIEVGIDAFQYCSALTQVSLPKATTIRYSCFEEASKLSTVNLSNVQTVESAAFIRCSSLKTINLPQVKELLSNTFYSCTLLEKADLGSCQRFDGQTQFGKCAKLTTLILRGNAVCSASYPVNSYTGALGDTPIANGNGYVYVPKVLVDEYKKATNWVEIAGRIRAIEDYPEITGG